MTRLGQNGVRLFFSKKSPLRVVEGAAESGGTATGGGGKKGDEIELTDVAF